MSLRLEVLQYRGLPPARSLARSLDEGVCTLGRNPDNDLVLEDPERLVSSRHAKIEIREQGVWIIDHSTNGTFLNRSSDRLPSDQPVELHDGDTLSVGPYEISVAIDAIQGEPEPHADEREALPGMEAPGPEPDIMDLLGGSGGEPRGSDRAPSQDPFSDARPLDPFLAGPAPQDEGPRAAEPRQTPVEHVFFRPPESQPIPEGYDLLSDALLPATPEDAEPESPRAATAEPPKPQVGGGPSFDQIPDLSPDLNEGAALQAQPEPPASGPGDLQPLSPEGTPFPSSGIAESFAPPPEPRRQDEQAEAPVPPVPTPGASSPPREGRELADPLAALMSGLGVGDPSQVGNPEALLRDAGALLRALTTGLTATMIARAQFKSELRLGVTTIRRTENNPFKFCVSPEEALERLLLRPNPAYLPALEAARGAFEDIQAHEMAMIAGLRAALRALLARFEPGALEARLDAASGLDRLLPMARKSRYWDLFTETYEQVAADAAEDFMQLFGEAFTRAYEDQILRLARAREQQPK
ncbi:MAG: type VI secretion system-associated FHA domain protein TagH [Chromatiaceae bacterium]